MTMFATAQLESEARFAQVPPPFPPLPCEHVYMWELLPCDPSDHLNACRPF